MKWTRAWTEPDSASTFMACLLNVSILDCQFLIGKLKEKADSKCHF